MARLGSVEQVVITARHGELCARLVADGIPVRPVTWRAGLDPRAFVGVRRELARRTSGDPTVIHAHDSHGLALAAFALAVVARRGRGFPLVATRRVTFPVRPGSWWLRADRVIAVSAAVRDALVAAGTEGGKVTVVHSGLDLAPREKAGDSVLRRTLGLPDGTPLASCLAALTPEKDHRGLLDAAAMLKATEPSLHWVFIGDGPLRSTLERHTARVGLTDRVHFVGDRADGELLLEGSTVMTSSSTAEGFGTAVLAAMALGIPVVATRVGGLTQLLAGGAGLLVPPRDPGALADAVGRVLQEEVLRESLVRRGRLRAASFSAATMAAGTLAVYRSLVQPH
ncbi:MAG: glycosyltransferase family 4 protein [Gemmatimonadales bacterium]|nr:glycosyltransferase family 4 protein [Gemmatimonadales bacterium]